MCMLQIMCFLCQFRYFSVQWSGVAKYFNVITATFRPDKCLLLWTICKCKLQCCLKVFYCTTYCMCIHTFVVVRAGQCQAALSRSAGAYAVRQGAPCLGRAPFQHLTAEISVQAPATQVTLIFASDPFPMTGRNSQQVSGKCV